MRLKILNYRHLDIYIKADYYAAAVQYCGGEDNLPTSADLQNLMNCTYTTPKGNYIKPP